MQFKLNNALSACLSKDKFKLKRAFEKLSAMKDGKEKTEALERFLFHVDASQSRVKNRQASLPAIEYPELPIADKREEIKSLISNNQVVVIAGETGSGKTTQLPKMCLELGLGVNGFIGHTQPRRLAARSVASRLADELNTKIGDTVGFKIRFSDNVSETSLVKLMTDGILLAEIQKDRFLSNYQCIIIDEAHERSLNIDFLLGYFKQILPKRKDLKLIITSATIDPERFSKHFNNAPIISVSGRTYPVDIRYQEPLDEKEYDQISEILRAVDHLMHEKLGDILIFLSGEREIRDTQDALQKAQYRNTEIVPLFARLSSVEQNRIFQPHSMRRIVLATNVAETSLTVPGIKYVIDPGWVRISRYSHRSKVQRLPIEPISKASAAQRAGRCGRTSAGICIRLYSEDDFNSRPNFTDPEIMRTHLSSVILQMHALRLGDIDAFPFLQVPDSKNIKDAIKVLQELQALEVAKKKGPYRGQFALTDIGMKMSKLPLDPKYSRMVIEADKRGCVNEVIIITAGLSIQDPRERPLDKQQLADQHHAMFEDKNSDFLTLFKLWNVFKKQQMDLSNNQLRKWCKAHFVHYLRMREWQDIVSQLKKAIVEVGIRLNTAEPDYEQLHTALSSGLLSQIGLKDKNREYIGARNNRFLIFPGSPISKVQPKWILASELVETSKLYARTVAKIDTKWIEHVSAHLLTATYSEPHWSKKRGSVLAYMNQTLFGLPLVNRRLVNYSSIDHMVSRKLFIRDALVNNQTQMKFAFLKKNQSLVDDVETLELKSRRRDILVDEEDLVAFYSSNIPENICSDASFRKWWKSQSEKTPDLLDFDPEKLLKKDTSFIRTSDYPDEWKQGNLSLPLTYEFEPNNEFDGVCLHIPLPLLNQVQDVGFDWLVPGFRKELIQCLIKSLPKRLRRNFVPAPNYADACLADIKQVNSQGAPNRLLDEVVCKLEKMSGIRVASDEFDLAQLPKHLSFNFAVFDESNVLIGKDKSLTKLKEKFSSKVKNTFSEMATPNLERSDVKTWDFDSLPDSFEKKHAGYQIKAFPALVYRNNQIDIALLDTQVDAFKQHQLGVYHLIKQVVPSPLKHLQEKLPNKAKLGLYFNPFGHINVLINDIVLASIKSITLKLESEIDRSIRSQADFKQACDRVRENINDKAYEIALSVEKGLTIAYSVQKQTKGNIPLNMINNISSVKAQLDRLVYKGFVFDFGEKRLGDWNRYVKALALRMDKLKVDVNKDRLNQLEIDKAIDKFEVAKNKFRLKSDVPQALLDVIWMIEELKVSLFAQQLGTAFPISLKRIENKLSEF